MSTTSPPDPDGTAPAAGEGASPLRVPVDPAPGSPATDPTEAPASVGLWASVLVLLRRWPIVIIGINLTLAVGLAVVKVVPVTYAATGTLLISLPPETTKGDTKGSTPVNPYIGSRGFVGDLLITIMTDGDSEARVTARGGTGEFTAMLSLGDAALLKVDTTGKSADEALATWTATADETKASLLSLQKSKDVPDSLLISADPLTRPLEAQRQSGSRIRALIAVLGLGFGATVALAFAAESLGQFRRLRRGETVDPNARHIRRKHRRAGPPVPATIDEQIEPEVRPDEPTVEIATVEPFFSETEELLLTELLDRQAEDLRAAGDTGAGDDPADPRSAGQGIRSGRQRGRS
jgi:hypothetical protein